MYMTLCESEELIKTELMKVHMNLAEKLLLLHSISNITTSWEGRKAGGLFKQQKMKLMQSVQSGPFSPH